MKEDEATAQITAELKRVQANTLLLLASSIGEMRENFVEKESESEIALLAVEAALRKTAVKIIPQ